MESLGKSTMPAASTDEADFFKNTYSLIKNFKKYGSSFMKLLRKENEAQAKYAVSKQTTLAILQKDLDETLDFSLPKGSYLIRTENELDRMEVTKGKLTVTFEKQQFEIKFEQELSRELIPKISKLYRIREEKWLIVSKIPDAIVDGDPWFTLYVEADISNHQRIVNALREAIRYAVDKIAGQKASSLEDLSEKNVSRGIDYSLNCNYNQTNITFENRHIYHLLLEDHKISTSLEDCFFIQEKTTPKAKLSSNLTISLGESQLPNREFELDFNQLEAIGTALSNPISLIIGPPGTGKTYTAAILAMILTNQIQKDGSDKKLLVCAQSNTGVNNLANKLIEYGLNVTKISGYKLMENQKNLNSFDLCSKLKKKVQDDQDFKALSNTELLDVLNGKWNPEDEDDYTMIVRLKKHFKNIMSETDVVCCTLSMIPSNLLNNVEFPFIIMDEASQAIEPEALIAFNKHPQSLIMFGDHHQLCPTVISQEQNVQLELSYSLFQRLVEKKLPDTKVHMLNTQYRMPDRLIQFSSSRFYNSKLKSQKTSCSKELSWIFEEFRISDKSTPIALFETQSQESIKGVSVKNEGEAKQVVATVQTLLRKKVRPDRIGVIAYYTFQVEYIKDLLYSRGMYGIEVSSVDGFQGRDKDIILISLVRSNDRSQVGFTSDYQRMNVAVTRAKEWVFIFCNRDTIKNARIWDSYLKQYRLY